ncbi:hypothetical protein P3S68_005259 [Capsicum galapagoense]
MENSIFVEREELMVSPSGGIPHLRKAHFLNPIASSIEGPNVKPPSLYFLSESEWPLRVSFNGCRHQQIKWKKWVEAMESVHHYVWKAAGVYDPIKGSVYKVHTDKNLIFGLAERWCCDTNTFVFPWGEATVTLEDMMILGGFSVLGGQVSFPLQSPELVEIEQNLEKARMELIGLKADNHNRWLNFFMNSGRDYEHEAFLSLWLSRFVFPGEKYDKIGTHVFRVAINLARGKRLALAPAVLSSIYRDLSLLREAMTIATSSSNKDDRNRFQILGFSLSSPLFFIQVWAWERLVALRPKQAGNYNMVGGVRIGRWHDVKRSGVINVRTAIDSSAETFQWRPYALAVEGCSVPTFYKETEEWEIFEGKMLDQELESFIRCLRVSVLVGFDCQEPYRPNRVAMQFGFDQDFPKWIPCSPSIPQLAWNNYSRPSDSDLRLCYPSRLFEPDVSTKYLKWWRKEVLLLVDAFEGLSKERRSKTRLKLLSNNCDSPSLPTKCQLKQVENYPDAPPGLPPKYPDAPPGFPPKFPDAPPGFPPKYPDAPPEFPPKYPDAPPGFPPKSSGENDKKNLSKVVSQSLACNVVPPGLREKHTAGKDVHTSTEAHDSSSVVPPNCIVEYGKENLSKEVCQSAARDVAPPSSTEKHTDCEHDRTENNSTAHNLVVGEQGGGERTICDDIIEDIELYLRELKRSAASHRRC